MTNVIHNYMSTAECITVNEFYAQLQIEMSNIRSRVRLRDGNVVGTTLLLDEGVSDIVGLVDKQQVELFGTDVQIVLDVNQLFPCTIMTYYT